jgi:hypothetical protein
LFASAVVLDGKILNETVVVLSVVEPAREYIGSSESPVSGFGILIIEIIVFTGSTLSVHGVAIRVDEIISSVTENQFKRTPAVAAARRNHFTRDLRSIDGRRGEFTRIFATIISRSSLPNCRSLSSVEI